MSDAERGKDLVPRFYAEAINGRDLDAVDLLGLTQQLQAAAG